MPENEITLPKNERRISLAEAVAVTAELGPARSSMSLWRWVQTGRRTRDGRTVRLQHERSDGKISTSAEAVRRFLRETERPVKAAT